jgi:hypothetical protein
MVVKKSSLERLEKVWQGCNFFHTTQPEKPNQLVLEVNAILFHPVAARREHA